MLWDVSLWCGSQVLLETTSGDVDIELWSKEAPKACRNFVQLCFDGYYEGTIFHRIIKGELPMILFLKFSVSKAFSYDGEGKNGYNGGIICVSMRLNGVAESFQDFFVSELYLSL